MKPSQCAAGNVFFGLDNTQPNLLRIVSLVVEKPFRISLVGFARCKNAQQLRAFLQQNRKPVVVAASNLKHDPCSAIFWAEQHKIPLKRFWALSLFHPSDLGPEPGLPNIYQRAYSLAIRAGYEFEAPRALESLWREIYWARVAFEQLERTANALYMSEVSLEVPT